MHGTYGGDQRLSISPTNSTLERQQTTSSSYQTYNNDGFTDHHSTSDYNNTTSSSAMNHSHSGYHPSGPSSVQGNESNERSGGFGYDESSWYGSSSTLPQQGQQQNHNEPLPSPSLSLPHMPSSVQGLLSDQYLAGQQPWGPFVLSDTPSSTNSFLGPSSGTHHSRDASSQSPWSTHQSIPQQLSHTNPPSGYFDSLNHIFSNDGHTPTSETGFGYPGYFPSQSQTPTPQQNALFGGNSYSHESFISSRKGKEKANNGDMMGDLGRELRKSRSDGHNEFEKDIALLETYLTDLIGLLQPFAASPDQPDPPKPPPFLHTRFLRLTTAIHQTLVNLAVTSHPSLSADHTDLPISTSESKRKNANKTPNEPQTTAEKEMELIRKRRDWLIAKAAQTKAANANNASSSLSFNNTTTSGITTQNHSASASPFLGQLQPPPVLHPLIHANLQPYGLDAAGGGGGGGGTHLPFSGGGGAAMGLGPDGPASLAYERGYTGPLIGRTAENPSGRCHSCGIQGAIEWRRGPDGAKTLCDSCGNHYAKISRRMTSNSPSPASLPPAPLLN